MSGFIGFASIYQNGLLALLFVFVFPGLVFVRAFDVPSFPQRWLIVFLSSLTANYFFVTLIASLHFDPLAAYRIAAVVLSAILIVSTATKAASGRPWRGESTISLSDIRWLLISLTVLGFTYFNVWKHGVPHVFEAGDLSVSWNVWALIWSKGGFPTSSLGYPQFIPTVFAVTYIFTASTVQYFAHYVYIVLIIAPIAIYLVTEFFGLPTNA